MNYYTNQERDVYTCHSTSRWSYNIAPDMAIYKGWCLPTFRFSLSPPGPKISDGTPLSYLSILGAYGSNLAATHPVFTWLRHRSSRVEAEVQSQLEEIDLRRKEAELLKGRRKEFQNENSI